MKYDYIYSEAVEIINNKKDEGTKFFSRDTLCLIVTESGKLFSAFNTSDIVDGKLVTGSSEKAALKKLKSSGETRIDAVITMNCSEMIPVIPDNESVSEILELDRYNSSADVISPALKYIKIKDLPEYDPEGDNSAIEVISVDINAKRDSREKMLDFVPDFNQVTDESESKSETKFLFAMPGKKSEDKPLDEVYRHDDVAHQYQPLDGRPGTGLNQAGSQFSNYSQMSSQPYMQPGMNSVYMQPGMNSMYMQPGMNPMYMQPGMNPMYMQPGMNQMYMQPGMNPQYMPQDGMNPQYMPQDGMNPQYMPQDGMNPQYMPQDGMNPMYMQPGMYPQYMQYGMPPQNMQYSMQMSDIAQQNMQQGGVNQDGSPAFQNGMNTGYPQPGMNQPFNMPYNPPPVNAPPQFTYPENYKKK